MDTRKTVFKKTAVVAVGVTLGTGVMLAVFGLLGSFHPSVLLGGIAGSVLAVANFLFMSIGASLAANRAQKQDVRGGRAMISRSFLLRMAVLFVILYACGESGLFDPLALTLPLCFVRPVLGAGEFLRRNEVGEP